MKRQDIKLNFKIRVLKVEDRGEFSYVFGISGAQARAMLSLGDIRQYLETFFIVKSREVLLAPRK